MPSDGEDRVANRRRKGRQRRLAQSRRRIIRFDEMYVDLGRIRIPQQRVRIEVGLGDFPLLHGHFERHHRAETVCHGTDALMLGIAWVEDWTHIPYDSDTVHFDLLPGVNTDFRDFSEVAGVRDVERETQRASRGHFPAPTATFSGELDDTRGPPGVERSSITRGQPPRLTHDFQEKLNVTALGSNRQLMQEALN